MTTLALADEERRLVLQLLEQEIRDLHHGIHHCRLLDAKRALQERLAAAERLVERLKARAPEPVR